MLYETHYREGKKVTFKKFDLNIAGLLFLPDNFDEGVNAGKKISCNHCNTPRRRKRTMPIPLCLEFDT